VAKPEWWNDEELKALSARVVRAAPNDCQANQMRAAVLSGQGDKWEAGPRSAAELMEAAAHCERAAAARRPRTAGPALARRSAPTYQTKQVSKKGVEGRRREGRRSCE